MVEVVQREIQLILLVSVNFFLQFRLFYQFLDVLALELVLVILDQVLGPEAVQLEDARARLNDVVRRF